MSCPDSYDRLSAYHDGELDAPERDALEEHLAGCPTCRRDIEAMRQISELFVGSRVEAEPPEHLRAHIVAAARRSHARALRRWGKALPRVAAALIGFALYTGGAALLGHLDRNSRTAENESLATVPRPTERDPVDRLLAEAAPNRRNRAVAWQEKPQLLDGRPESQILAQLLAEKKSK